MNQPVWTAEHEVDAQEATRLIESQFKELAPARVRRLGHGWDNVAYEVNDTLVFRFPRREAALLGLRMEQAVLPFLAGRLPAPIPCPIYFGSPETQPAGYPWMFLGYNKVEGRTACSAALGDADRARSAEPLALFLRALHAIDAGEAETMGAVPDFQQKADIADRAPTLAVYLREQHAKGIMHENPANYDWVMENAAERRHFRRTLLHGDLYVRHLIVDAAGLFSGVIDWGDVCTGDPAADLCIAHSFLPPRAHAAFCNAYGPIEPDTWRIARFRALAYAATLLDFGSDTADADLLREAHTILRFLDEARR